MQGYFPKLGLNRQEINNYSMNLWPHTNLAQWQERNLPRKFPLNFFIV